MVVDERGRTRRAKSSDSEASDKENKKERGRDKKKKTDDDSSSSSGSSSRSSSSSSSSYSSGSWSSSSSSRSSSSSSSSGSSSDSTEEASSKTKRDKKADNKEKSRSRSPIKKKEKDKAAEKKEKRPEKPKSKPARSKSPSPKRKRKERSPTPKPVRIYIGRLTRNVTKEHIAEIFGNFGQIKMVEYPTDRFHPPAGKGFAYVEFGTPEMAENAMKHMDGGQIDGQEVTCAPVLLPTKMAARGGRRTPPPSHLHEGDGVELLLASVAVLLLEVRHRADARRHLLAGIGLPEGGAGGTPDHRQAVHGESNPLCVLD
uniref:RNA-binding protein with serine-rich domain 1 n=1 Tax=Lygus hesperus TaxID=30085 RepID=A0A0A9XDX9_LYGHE